MISNIKITTLFEGFPARSTRGYLGWSSVHLIPHMVSFLRGDNYPAIGGYLPNFVD